MTERGELAALLRSVAAGRREYAAALAAPIESWAIEQRAALEAEAAAFESAAKIVEGDLGPLYGLLPSWRWTGEMTRRLDGS